MFELMMLFIPCPCPRNSNNSCLVVCLHCFRRAYWTYGFSVFSEDYFSCGDYYMYDVWVLTVVLSIRNIGMGKHRSFFMRNMHFKMVSWMYSEYVWVHFMKMCMALFCACFRRVEDGAREIFDDSNTGVHLFVCLRSYDCTAMGET